MLNASGVSGLQAQTRSGHTINVTFIVIKCIECSTFGLGCMQQEAKRESIDTLVRSPLARGAKCLEKSVEGHLAAYDPGE
jgi:hypothetical protein